MISTTRLKNLYEKLNRLRKKKRLTPSMSMYFFELLIKESSDNDIKAFEEDLTMLTEDLHETNVKKGRGFEKVSYCDQEATILPSRKTKQSACYDFYLPETVTIKAGTCSKMIPLNIKAYMPEDEVLLLFVRSSIGVKRGLMLVNNVGIIDSDFYNCDDGEGNIGIKLFNCGNEDQTLNEGERVVQGMFIKYGTIDNDDVRATRSGGMGSTGE